MAELVLQNEITQADVLIVDIEGKKYSIPLANTMKVKEIKALAKEGGYLSLIEKYIPSEIIEEMSYGNVEKIIQAWDAESEKRTGHTVGESSNLQNSSTTTGMPLNTTS